MEDLIDCQTVVEQTNNLKRLTAILAEKDQEISRLTALLEDEQSQCSRSLQDTHDFYESILTLIPCPVYWLDKNNVYLGCNDLQAKEAQLKSRKDIVGKTNEDLLTKEEALVVNQLNETVMQTGETHIAEEYAVMANGLTVYLSTKTPLRDKNDKVIGLLGVSVDITEQKKTQAALQRAKEKSERDNQAKTDFIANANHDLSPSLRAIVALSRIMEAETNAEKEKEYAQCIYNCSNELLNLLNEVVLSVSSDNIGELDIQANSLWLPQKIQDVMNLVLPMLKLKQIHIQTRLSPAIPPSLLGDSNKLKKILLYLLGHVIETSKKNDSIQFDVERLNQDSSYAQLQFNIRNLGGSKPADETASPPYLGEEQNCSAFKITTAEKYIGLLGGELERGHDPGERASYQFVLSFKIQ